jgi:hypothetical protein
MTETTSNIFLSWSGKVSNAIALSFNTYLPYIIQASNPFFSPEGISKDESWFKKINSELISSKTGIVFLTKENLSKDWIFFESGGIFSKGSLCVLLCDCEIAHLKEKKSIFQHLNVTSITDRKDLLRLFHTINGVISPNVDQKIIDRTFDKYFDEFQTELNESLNNTKTPEMDTSTLEGKWNLKYKSRIGPFEGGENLRLTKDGKYYLEDGGERYYFQLNVLRNDGASFVWQKLRVADEHPTDEVHSVENVKMTNGGTILQGEDTLGYTLIYTKVE